MKYIKREIFRLDLPAELCEIIYAEYQRWYTQKIQHNKEIKKEIKNQVKNTIWWYLIPQWHKEFYEHCLYEKRPCLPFYFNKNIRVEVETARGIVYGGPIESIVDITHAEPEGHLIHNIIFRKRKGCRTYVYRK